MTHDKLERDLRLVLRDMAPTDAPAALREAVAAVPRTHPVPASRAAAANRQRFLAFAGIAAVIAVVAAGLALTLSGRFNVNVAAPSPSAAVASPSATAWTRLTFVYADPGTSSASPAASASSGSGRTQIDIAGMRLSEVGIAYSITAHPDGFSVTVPADAEALAVRSLVTGRLDFVPLGSAPVATGGTVDLKVHPALFSNDGVGSAYAGTDQTGGRTLGFTLTGSASKAFAAYTRAHIGEYFAIVLDGKVLTAPVIQSAIANGQVEITTPSAGGVDLETSTLLAAIIVTGPLPRPLIQTSSAQVAPPSEVSTPAPSTAPTPTPTAAPVVIPSQTTLIGVPGATGTPMSVGPVFNSVNVQQLSGAVVNAPRVVAWTHGYLGLGIGDAGDNTGWTSPDGRSWMPWPDGALGTGSGGARLIGFAACRDSALAFFTANGSIYAAASPDGRTWTTSLVDSGVDSRYAYAPLAGGDRGAIIAPIGDRAVIATSDCSTWQKVPLNVPSDLQIIGVAATSGGWVAVGSQGTSADNVKAVAFWSSDGTTWNAADVADADGMGFIVAPSVGSQGMVALASKAGTTIAHETYYQSFDGKSWKPMDGNLGLGFKTDTDGSSVPAATYIGDGRQMLAYGQRNGDSNRGFEYDTSLDGNIGYGVSFDGPASSSVIDFDTAGQYTPVLLRDGILFLNSNGPSLFGQAVGQ